MGYETKLVKNIISSQAARMKMLKHLLLTCLVILGAAELMAAIGSFTPDRVYRKDFIQEYLLAKALLNNIAPYAPIPVLSNQILGPLPVDMLQHPTPHPPPIAIISLPLGMLTYRQAAAAWFALELVCIVICSYGLLRYFSKPQKPLALLVLTFSILAWNPVTVELIVGQLMVLVLVCLIGAWQMLRKQKEWWGGLLLGCAISIKLIAWPILVYLALCKRWRAVTATCLTVILSNLVSALFMGFETVATYYFKIGPSVASLYHSYISNFSLWSLSWKVLEGTGSKVLVGITAPPLIIAPELAEYTACIIPLAILATGLCLALKTADFDISFGILICASLLVSPVTWYHYLVLALIPLTVLIKKNVEYNSSSRLMISSIFLLFVFLITQDTINNGIKSLSGISYHNLLPYNTSFSISIIAMLPAVSIICLIFLLWCVGNTNNSQSNGIKM